MPMQSNGWLPIPISNFQFQFQIPYHLWLAAKRKTIQIPNSNSIPLMAGCQTKKSVAAHEATNERDRAKQGRVVWSCQKKRTGLPISVHVIQMRANRKALSTRPNVGCQHSSWRVLPIFALADGHHFVAADQNAWKIPRRA